MRLVIAGGVWLVALAPLCAAGGNDAEQARSELETLQERIGTLRSRLQDDRQDRDQLTRQLEEMESVISRHSRRLRELADDISDSEARLEALREQRAQRRDELSEDRETLARHLREAWITGRRGRLRMLLNQEDPAAVGRVLAYYDYINRARGERIQALGQRLEELVELEQNVLERREALAALHSEQRRTVSALQARRTERSSVLGELEQEIARGDQQLSRLQEDEQRLQNLVQSLQRELADVPDELERHTDFAELRGRLPPPVNAAISEGYGTPRHGGRLRSRGVLFEAPEGSEIIAVSRGRIAFAEWLPNYGLVVIVEHGGDYLTLYGHTREVYRDVGDWVEQGEVLASVGDSGGRRSAALYFEIRAGREPVDPAPWLDSSRARAR